MSYEIEYIYKKGSIVSFEESGRGGSDSYVSSIQKQNRIMY
jgi:hypothetical protein